MNQPPDLSPNSLHVQNFVEPEIVEENDKLVKYASQTGLETTATQTLVEAFKPAFVKARDALAAARGVAESVKDATCVTEIRKARACRLALRAVRIEGEAIHKKQKENVLRFGKAVDGFRNILLADIGPVEDALQDAEDTAERAEAARKAALKTSREEILRPLLDPNTPMRSDLGELPEESFKALLEDTKLLRQAKIDAAARAESERLAKEEADRKERARIAAENARLKAEKEAAEAAAKAEREAAEKKLADERAAAQKAAKVAEEKAAKERAAAEAKAKAEREVIEKKAKAEADKLAAEKKKLEDELEAKRKSELEAKQKAEAEAKAAALAAKKAAAAPDKAKLLAFADVIAHLDQPNLNDPSLEGQLRANVKGLADWCAITSNNL